MTGQYRHPPSITTDQFIEPLANFHRRMAVIGQGQDTAGILAPRSYEIGNSMNNYPRLAGTRAGKHQHVCLFSIVRNNALLNGIVQTFNDLSPRFRCRLPRGLFISIWHPALEKFLFVQHEVVFRQSCRLMHLVKTELRVFANHMYLKNLSFVVKIQRFKIGLGKAAAFPFQDDGHGWSEHRQALVKSNDFLFVKPKKCAISQPNQVLIRNFRFKSKIRLDCLG